MSFPGQIYGNSETIRAEPSSNLTRLSGPSILFNARRDMNLYHIKINRIHLRWHKIQET